MPIKTRKQVQSSIPFKCRKTRNSSKTPQNETSQKCPSEKYQSSTDLIGEDHSLCVEGQMAAVRPAATRQLTNEPAIKDKGSHRSTRRRCDVSRTPALTTPPSPRKRTLLQEVSTNDAHPPSPCCSPRKMKKENIPLGMDSARKQSAVSKQSPEPVAETTLKAAASPRLDPMRRTPEKSAYREPERLAASRSGRKEIHVDAKQSISLTPTKTRPSPKKCRTPMILEKAEGESYSRTKQALHTALPDHLLCRDKELESITSFLKSHLNNSKAGSLYISGAPGTGKTACLSQVLNHQKKVLSKAQVLFVNCMSVRQSQGIYSKVWENMNPHGGKTTAKEAAKKLQKTFTSPGPMVVLVLDEIDQLDSKGQEVLYTMFEWPSLPKSRLILIGIANALDLTDRILPRLQARPKCKPQLLHFPPYSKEQIATILLDRVQSGSDDNVVESVALQLCARKVAAVAGDIRKALEVCRRAVEIVECDVKSQLRFNRKSPASNHGSSTTCTASSPPGFKKVGVKEVSSVIAEVYGSRLTASCNLSQIFPLQQKLMVCTVLRMVRGGRLKEVTLGKCHEAYQKICKERRMPTVEQSEFLSLCQLVESRGLIGLKYSKDTRQSKICLKLNEKEVETSLQDKVLLSAILLDDKPRK